MLGTSDNLIIMKNGKVAAYIKRGADMTEHDVITEMIEEGVLHEIKSEWITRDKVFAYFPLYCVPVLPVQPPV